MERPDVMQSLKVEICPYLVAARQLDKWTAYRVYTAYSYLGELFVLLAGFGVSNPVIAYLGGRQLPNGPRSQLAALLGGTWTGWTALVFLLVWGTTKFYISKEDLEKRCSLVRSYRQQCLKMETDLRKLLATAQPALPDFKSKLYDLVDRSINEGVPIPTGDKLNSDGLADHYAAQLEADFSQFWGASPEKERAPKRGLI